MEFFGWERATVFHDLILPQILLPIMIIKMACREICLLQDQEIRRSFKAKDGTLFFGGQNGLIFSIHSKLKQIVN